MPNWCENTCKITGNKTQLLELFTKAKTTKSFFENILPIPQGLENSNDWCCANWGTKWDIEIYDVDKLIEQLNLETDETVTIDIGLFDTAWSPPLAIYYHLESLGFSVDAYFFEGGGAYYGWFYESCECTEFYQSIADIPSEIIEIFAIEDWEEEEDNEETE